VLIYILACTDQANEALLFHFVHHEPADTYNIGTHRQNAMREHCNQQRASPANAAAAAAGSDSNDE
jgi:hypothetical protein